MRKFLAWTCTALGLALALGAKCKEEPETDGAGGAGGGEGGEGGAGGAQELDPATVQAAAEAAVATQTMLVAVDTLFAFDPDLDPDAPEGENTETIRANALADGGACVDVMLVLGGVRVDWGAGCVLPSSGITVSGAITAKLSGGGDGAGGALTVTLEFEDFVVDGFDLDGTAAFSTENGSSFEVAMDLTHGDTIYGGDILVEGTPTSITLGGGLSLSDLDGNLQLGLGFQGVTFAPGDCYPGAGDATITVGALTGTLAFDADTVTTGQATLTTFFGDSCYELPAHGVCAPAACP